MSEDRGYLHGYDEPERQRLVRQSLFLEPWIYERVAYPGATKLLEVGCGVGAQLAILHRRFPALQLTGIDLVASQVEAARVNLSQLLAGGGARLVVGDGGALPFQAGEFDAGFLCWVLEHAPERAELLRDFRRVLAPGATLFCTEVFLATLYVSPHCPGIMRYWQIYQDHQVALGGDPQAGPRLGGWLARAGFTAIDLYPLFMFLDARTTERGRRERFFTYWQELLRSAVPGLGAAGLVDAALLAAVDADFARLRQDPEAIFHIEAVQARAQA